MRVFLFTALKTLSHCLLVWMWNQLLIMGDSFNMVNFFSHYFQDSLCVWLCQFDYNMSQCGSLEFFEPVGCVGSFLLSKLESFSHHSAPFSPLFLGVRYVYVDMLDNVPRSLRLCWVFYLLISVTQIEWSQLICL